MINMDTNSNATMDTIGLLNYAGYNIHMNLNIYACNISDGHSMVNMNRIIYSSIVIKFLRQH